MDRFLLAFFFSSRANTTAAAHIQHCHDSHFVARGKALQAAEMFSALCQLQHRALRTPEFYFILLREYCLTALRSYKNTDYNCTAPHQARKPLKIRA